MRSLRSLVLVLAVGCGGGVIQGGDDGTGSGGSSGSDGTGGDGSDVTSACETSYLDYENFGAPFVVNWCRGCHSSALPANMRQAAPSDVNFDDVMQVRAWQDRIAATTIGASPTMPPAGGPSDAERALLAEWLACGAR
jgi:uncharacterized membrane protein